VRFKCTATVRDSGEMPFRLRDLQFAVQWYGITNVVGCKVQIKGNGVSVCQRPTFGRTGYDEEIRSEVTVDTGRPKMSPLVQHRVTPMSHFSIQIQGVGWLMHFAHSEVSEAGGMCERTVRAYGVAACVIVLISVSGGDEEMSGGTDLAAYRRYRTNKLA
jgi:hypothetical protein